MKLKDRVLYYLTTLESEEFKNEIPKFTSLIEEIELKEIDFETKINILNSNIELVEDRAKQLDNYNLKSNNNQELYDTLLKHYSDLLIKLYSDRQKLMNYKTSYDEVKKLYINTITGGN